VRSLPLWHDRVMGDAENVVDADGVVRIGSVVFALIRPTPGHERAFNRWYERDHYYTAGLAAPGVFSAGRFLHPDGLHLALYFVLPGYEQARSSFAAAQVEVAAEEGRLFTEREHLHTWSYAIAGTRRQDREGVPPALALDHRYPQIQVSMFDGRAPLDALDQVGGPEIDLAIAMTPVGRIMPSQWDGGGDLVGRVTVVTFHRAAGAVPAPSGAVWSAPFVPVVFGTDSHLVG
jgi:hypothetical protein